MTHQTLSYKVNEHITLKLENAETRIYVDKLPFMQCIRLTIHIPLSKIDEFSEIDSIDEAAEISNKYLYRNQIIKGMRQIEFTQENHAITPEQEFKAHCSNIQVWYEHDYDTRLLHSNLSFPLLRKLADVGDTKARIKLKDEILLRLESKFEPVIKFLLFEGYLSYFSDQEIRMLNENYDLYRLNIERFDLNLEHKKIMLQLQEDFLQPFQEIIPGKPQDTLYGVDVEDGAITGVKIIDPELRVFPLSLFKLNYIRDLHLNVPNLLQVPQEIGKLKSLERLHIRSNEISTLPTSLVNLTSLKSFILDGCRFKEILPIISKKENVLDLSFKYDMILTLHMQLLDVINLEILDLDGNLILDRYPKKRFLRNLSRTISTNRLKTYSYLELILLYCIIELMKESDKYYIKIQPLSKRYRFKLQTYKGLKDFSQIWNTLQKFKRDKIITFSVVALRGREAVCSLNTRDIFFLESLIFDMLEKRKGEQKKLPDFKRKPSIEIREEEKNRKKINFEYHDFNSELIITTTFKKELDGVISKFGLPVDMLESGRDLDFAKLEHVKLDNGRSQNLQYDVLLVEDDRPTRRLVSRMFENLGLTIKSFGGATGALDELENSQPLLILMDDYLPDLSGFEASFLIKSNPKTKHIPIIFFTLYTRDFFRYNKEHKILEGCLEKTFFFTALKTLTAIIYILKVQRGSHKYINL